LRLSLDSRIRGNDTPFIEIATTLSFRPRVKHGVTLLDAESKVWNPYSKLQIPVFTGMTD